MNKIILPFSIFISAGVGYWLGATSTTVEYPAQGSTGTVIQEAASSSPQNAFTPLMATAESAEKNSQLPATSGSDLSSLSSVSSSANLITQAQIDAIKEEYEIKQRAQAFTSWLTKKQETTPWFDLGTEMRGRFDEEEKDHQWASLTEGNIQSLFSQDPALAGIALKSTSCKSTQCRISISVMDQEHANETAMQITQILGREKFSQIIIDSQAQQGESVFYMARDDKGFKFD
jgi:hypothetical protein